MDDYKEEQEKLRNKLGEVGYEDLDTVKLARELVELYDLTSCSYSKTLPDLKSIYIVDDILPGVNAGVSSRWGYRLPTHGGNLRVRMLLVGN
jgi:hypothetical protein